MVYQLRLYNNTPVATYTDEFKDRITDSIKFYIKDHWNEYVTIEDESDDDHWGCLVKIKL